MKFASIHTSAAFTPGAVSVGPDKFGDDNGYEQSDRQAILSLEIGEQWVSPDYGNSHVVIRID